MYQTELNILFPTYLWLKHMFSPNYSLISLFIQVIKVLNEVCQRLSGCEKINNQVIKVLNEVCQRLSRCENSSVKHQLGPGQSNMDTGSIQIVKMLF